MTEKAENDRKNQSETNGFKFAVTLLAAFGTVSYTAYNYLQHTAVDIYWYVFLCGIISVTLILVGGLLSYILVKGFAMEVTASGRKEMLEGRASKIYLASFTVFVRLLVYILSLFVLVFMKITSSVLVVALLLVFLLFLVSYVLFLKEKFEFPKIDIIIVACLCVVAMAILLLPFPLLLNSPLQGHVTVDMDSICYKDGAPIPVLIQVTGPNTKLSINLSKESDHNLTLIDSIKLELEHNETQMAYKNRNSVLPGNLSGNALGEGKYSVFINTTNLTTGYYEIKSVRPEYTKSYGVKGFYLLDNS
ncbi:MAG: hypothetical protein EMLJLAPB_00911 [Candidatus Argoarchaeum ethanivorans]|uniref:Uncharacterized protein n=1 Tax=Candidatus Argoarchaeum ethanivorans TaxID=2608793 RepID=A0A811TB69_9EURY|nr:MAG: hypothetical protein EMLJLAPB_00911 [Candidatus Argoarchaeum ethanivorans]